MQVASSKLSGIQLQQADNYPSTSDDFARMQIYQREGENQEEAEGSRVSERIKN